MTRKDFELIAGVLRERYADAPELVGELAEVFADRLRGTNANFDGARFVDAVRRGQ